MAGGENVWQFGEVEAESVSRSWKGLDGVTVPSVERCRDGTPWVQTQTLTPAEGSDAVQVILRIPVVIK